LGCRFSLFVSGDLEPHSMKWHFPKREQWQNFFNVLSKKEKIFFFVFFFLMIFSGSFLATNFWLESTKIVPKRGGVLIEGVIGFPQRFNPLYLSNDAEMNVVEMIFAGLMKYTPEGKIEPQLANSYKILEEGRVYEFELKDKVFWHDGFPLTSDDVLFTVSLLKNPETKSHFRTVWSGIEVEKVSDKILRFRLKNKSGVFLENCTFKILPKHLLENIPIQNIAFDSFNIKPVGSGPFKIDQIQTNQEGKIISLVLAPNPYYFEKEKPYLSKIIFKFFNDEKEIISAFLKKQINGFFLQEREKIKNNSQILKEAKIYQISLPRYFAVFFNMKGSKILADYNTRLALNYATDKNEIKERVFNKEGEILSSPIFNQFYKFEEPKEKIDFDPQKAKELLKESSFDDKNGDGFLEKEVKRSFSFLFKSDLKLGARGEEVKKLQECLAKDKEIYPEGEITGYFGKNTKAAVMRFQERYKEEIFKEGGQPNGEVRKSTREKLNEFCFGKEIETIPLEVRLVSGNEEKLAKMALILKEQWERIGVKVKLELKDKNELETETIPKRDYDAFLFGESLKIIPDPFPFWHSSQIEETGLNLSNYENKEADKILEKAREELEDTQRKKDLEEFQEIFLKDLPAIILFSPNNYYLLSKKVNMSRETEKIYIFQPWHRFSLIEDWYIQTKRVLK
jgi:ABC-type transport system substrate-binding protein